MPIHAPADYCEARFTKFANSRRNHDRVIRALPRFQWLRCGLRIAIRQDVISKQSCGKPNAKREENKMTTDVNNLAKQAIHDKLESQIKTAEAKLDTLK